MKDYKVETKPTFWHVTLEEGCYSDWEIDSLFFHANDEFEVWDMLKRYATDIYDKKDYSGIKAMVWNDERFVVPGFLKERRISVDDVNWESGYGYAKKVTIKRLDVIEFKK